MNVKIYDKKGKEVGQAPLPKEIFDVKMNSDLVHQVVVSQMANRRQGTAQAKGRAEVRGGGRKPWRQKGTGRARHGSIRSPLWRGGGVTFGPTTEKVYKKQIPKKMRRKALFMVLSQKAKENLLVLVDDLTIEKPKTKAMAEILAALLSNKGSRLVVLPTKDDTIVRATRNIPKAGTMEARDLNTLDVLSYKYLVMPKEAIKVLEKTFLR